LLGRFNLDFVLTAAGGCTCCTKEEFFVELISAYIFLGGGSFAFSARTASFFKNEEGAIDVFISTLLFVVGNVYS
jgi:hypothetical protein